MFRLRPRTSRIRSHRRPCRGVLLARTAPRRHRHACGGISCRPRCWGAGWTGTPLPDRCPGSPDSARAAPRPRMTPIVTRTPLPPLRFLPVPHRLCPCRRAPHRRAPHRRAPHRRVPHRPAPGNWAPRHRIVSPPPRRRRIVSPPPRRCQAPAYRGRAGQILVRTPGHRNRKVRARECHSRSHPSRPRRLPWLYPRRRPWPRRASRRFRHPRQAPPRRPLQPHRVRPDRRPAPCPHPAVRRGTPGRPTGTGSSRATVPWSPHRLTGSSKRPGGAIAWRACW
jgi:hypothetical protein